MERNPNYPYIVIHDVPKLADLQRFFPDLYRFDRMLVPAARTSN
jgi:peptide-methionine (S)-S-oxide reductase